MARRFDPAVVASDDLDHDRALWFGIGRGRLLLVEGEVPTGARPEIESRGERLLGVLDGAPVWGLDIEERLDMPDTHLLVHLRQAYGQISDDHWILAGRAEQLATFHRTHQFCGQCGAPTQAHPTERAFRCDQCNHMAFPRLTPAVIMLVERDDTVLLAHGRQFPGRFFSALAGFVEPGESLEEAVAREVHEEVGLDIDDVRYFASQPWPFPHSLMIGFTATWAGGEIEIQEEEIVEAGWFRADDLPPSPKGGMSIAGWLIENWLRRQGAPI